LNARDYKKCKFDPETRIVLRIFKIVKLEVMEFGEHFKEYESWVATS